MRLLLALVVLMPPLRGAEPLPIGGIVHVAFRVSDMGAARRFYTGVLGLPEAADHILIWPRIEVNEQQHVLLMPGLAPGGEDRFSELGLATDDVARLRTLLVARGLTPTAVSRGTGPGSMFRLFDPDGNALTFVEVRREARPAPAARPPRISNQLRHAGLMVTDPERALRFYRDQLGLVEGWHGGPTDGVTRWINLRLPHGGGDYVELMLAGPEPTREQRGSMQHICLEVPDVERAWAVLKERGVPDEARHQPRTGRNGLRLLNLFDPDGSRVELMAPGGANPPAARGGTVAKPRP